MKNVESCLNEEMQEKHFRLKVWEEHRYRDINQHGKIGIVSKLEV